MIKKSDLCKSEQRLIGLLQRLNFGRIEELEVRGGEAIFDPPPRVIATLTMRAETQSRNEADIRDFSLKRAVVLFLLLIRQIGNGKILVIHVRHGLPVKVELEQPLLAGVRE